MNSWQLFWSGAGAALIGAVVGPIFTATLLARRRHRESLTAVLGEVRANLTILRAQKMSTEGEEDLERIPIQISISTHLFNAVSGDMAGWGAGTVRHVMIFYSWMRQLEQLVDGHRVAVAELSGKPHRVAEIAIPLAHARAMYIGASTTRDQAIERGEIALGWIEDELQRMADWESPRAIDPA